jgi:regulator of protease activity HflC (stomatin/prohibitin superfamily)
MKEKPLSSLSGIPTLLGTLALMLAGTVAIIFAVVLTKSGLGGGGLMVLAGIVLVTVGIFLSCGLYMVQPNQAAVLSLFGKYVGTVKDNGLRWNNPFLTKRKVSQRVRNFESGKLKVNELDGSPIEIAAVIVWQVVDASEAVYNVDDYESFVHIQSESAEISQHLKDELAERLADAGVQVLDARISHLAYAPEIAQAMLQRQQASAVIAARTQIVAGAVGMVEMALVELQKNAVVELDEERKAHMVSNLLTVLCSDRGTQPIVNAGSLY